MFPAGLFTDSGTVTVGMRMGQAEARLTEGHAAARTRSPPLVW